jgi:hypothetical protein
MAQGAAVTSVRGNKTNFVQKSPEISLILNKIVLVK